jgi:hypothetical protein
MTHLIYQWIDFIWLPIGVIIVQKEQRIMAFAFILTCLLTLRTQVELIESTGFDTGFLGFMESSMLSRGMVVYSIVIMLFLILAHYSPKTRGAIFFAATLSIYIIAFCSSMIIMVL